MRLSDARAQYVRWLHVAHELSLHTIRAYEGDVAALERYLGDAAAVEHVDRDQLLAFIDAQRADGLASRSIKRRIAGLRSFCRWMTSCGLIEADPWIGLTIRLGRSRTLPRALPSYELDRLLAFLRDGAAVGYEPIADVELARPHQATTLLAVALMVATGIRVGEVTSLRHRDIDLPGRSMRILGKGSRERHVYLPNDWITSLVRAYLTTHVALRITHDRLLFNTGGAPLEPPAMRSRLLTTARDAGVRGRVTPHMLRHSAATQLIEAGVDIRYIQRLLGHASLTTTELYTHVADHTLKRVVSNADILGRSFGRDN